MSNNLTDASVYYIHWRSRHVLDWWNQEISSTFRLFAALFLSLFCHHGTREHPVHQWNGTLSGFQTTIRSNNMTLTVCGGFSLEDGIYSQQLTRTKRNGRGTLETELDLSERLHTKNEECSAFRWNISFIRLRGTQKKVTWQTIETLTFFLLWFTHHCC